MKSAIRSTTQLARVMGLSRWTISRALNGHSGVHPKTVEKIKATARREGFAPSLLGRGLRTGRTDQVGICLPDMVDYFLTAKITLLQKAFEQRGLHPFFQIIDGTEGHENATLERFAAMHCAGVVLIASRLDRGASGLRGLQAADIPIVRIDPLNPVGEHSVSTDRHSAMREVLAHLHQLGHRKIVVAGFSPKNTYSRQRIEGLKRECRTLGWDFNRDVRILGRPAKEDDFSVGVSMAEAYLQAGNVGHAILAINDRVALGLVRSLQACGLSVPSDVSVIGYDNADFSPYASPPLTTIDPQVNLLIAQAVKMLDCGPKQPAVRKTGPILVKPKLVLRASDGPPPKSPRGNF
jgi:DNA-binding LacI/PurR family transcriptional regulator